MPRFKVSICQYPYGNRTHPAVSDWVANTVLKMAADPRIGSDNVRLWRESDTPIDMLRNRSLEIARRSGQDFVLMIDNDVQPDFLWPPGQPQAAAPWVTPWWETAWEFALKQPAPCVVAAPYVGPPPDECVYAFRWTNKQGNNPNPDFSLEMYSRHEASWLRGVERASALATGLMLIDLRVLDVLPKPWFHYEWKDLDGNMEPKCSHCGHCIPGERSVKASTEDVQFTRDLTMVGVPIYCTWSSWAGHYKTKLCGPPQVLGPDVVPQFMRKCSDLVPGLPSDPTKPVNRIAGAMTQAVDGIPAGNFKAHGLAGG